MDALTPPCRSDYFISASRIRDSEVDWRWRAVQGVGHSADRLPIIFESRRAFRFLCILFAVFLIVLRLS